MPRKLLGTIGVEFDVTDNIVIIYTAFVKYVRRIGINEEVHQIFIDFRKT